MRHFLNEIEVSPRDVLTIGLSNDFTDRPDILESTADRIVLPREGRDIILQHMATQGPFEGVPYRMTTSGGINLEYYVDLLDNPVFRQDEIEVSIKRRGGKDNFFDNADGTSFALMDKQGVNFEFINVPYLIIKDNAIELALTLGVSIYILSKDLIDQIVRLSETITNIIDAVTPNTGTGVTFNIGLISTLVIKAALQIAVIGLTLFALVKMAQDFFEIIFPKVRTFKACKVRELIEKGCKYLGYSFESTLLDSLPGLTILPVPLKRNQESIFEKLQNDRNFSYTLGYPTASDTTPQLGDLIRQLETIFNGRTRVNNNVVRFERRDYWANLTQNQIEPAVNLQDRRQDEYTLNTAEAWKRYWIHYAIDQTDVHTLDFFDPTDAEYSTEPLNVINADLVTIKGLNNVDIPFALGVRKSDLNLIEKIAKGFFDVVDEVVNALGGNGNFASQINNRIGVLQVSQQHYTTTKLLYTVAGKQPENYADIIRASAIYNNFHAINDIRENDFKVIEGAPMEINDEDFVNLLDNNFAEINGEICEILTIQYFDEQSKAVISYKCPFDYATGKVEVITINN